MINSVLLGLWSSIIALGAAYFGMIWSIEAEKGSSKSTAEPQKITYTRVKPISVPITAEGRISGYVIAQFSYTARADVLKKLEVKPEVFLYDAAFSAIFTKQKLDIGSLGKESWKEFSMHVRDAVNTRLGSAVVQEIITEEFGYVPYEQSRGRRPTNTQQQGN